MLIMTEFIQFDAIYIFQAKFAISNHTQISICANNK